MTLEHLFRPLAIGGRELPCRIVSTSHQTTLVHDNLPTEDFVAYQAARAQGGVGLIVMEAVAIDPTGLLTSHTIGGYLDGTLEAYRTLARAIQPHGTKLFVQLFHGGREVIASSPKPVVVSSSAMPSHRYHTEPRALRTDEVEDLIAAYARCAEVAQAAGLDGIEITAAHGYLGEQFFRSEWNARDDRFSEHGRFLLESIAAVREAAPDVALGVRFSADSAAAQVIAPQVAGLVDYLHLAVGNSSTFDGCLDIVPPPPRPRNMIEELTGPFQLGKPLIATSRVVDPVDAERIIASGRADAVGMNRALITDPDLPRKTREGRAGDVLRCIGCNVCITHYHAETPIRCAQNPRTGRELTLPRATAADSRKRVAVVGGGPAGLAAAAELAGLGQSVVLLEAGDALGGQVRLAGASPSHAELADSLLANYETLLAAGDVEVRLGVRADAEALADLHADAIIVATGAAPFWPASAVGHAQVTHVWDILAGVRPAGPVLIADWGGDQAALDCAELLAAEGYAVTLAEGAVTPGESLHQYNRNLYLGRLYRAGVTIEHHLGLTGVTPTGGRFANIFAPELVRDIDAATVALSLGRTPQDALAGKLRRLGVAFTEAGDCRSPRGLEEAILEGTMAARAVVAETATVTLRV